MSSKTFLSLAPWPEQSLHDSSSRRAVAQAAADRASEAGDKQQRAERAHADSGEQTGRMP